MGYLHVICTQRERTSKLFCRANEEVNSFVPGPLALEKRLGGIANKITDSTVELWNQLYSGSTK